MKAVEKKIVIIGAGPAGIFTALEMVRRLALGLPQPACTAFPAEEPAHLMQKGAPARDV